MNSTKFHNEYMDLITKQNELNPIKPAFLFYNQRALVTESGLDLDEFLDNKILQNFSKENDRKIVAIRLLLEFEDKGE